MLEIVEDGASARGRRLIALAAVALATAGAAVGLVASAVGITSWGSGVAVSLLAAALMVHLLAGLRAATRRRVSSEPAVAHSYHRGDRVELVRFGSPDDVDGEVRPGTLGTVLSIHDDQVDVEWDTGHRLMMLVRPGFAHIRPDEIRPSNARPRLRVVSDRSSH